MLTVVMSSELKRAAHSQYTTRVTVEPRRGAILDRFGRPLTEDPGDYVSLGVNPRRVTDPKGLATDLAKITGKPADFYRSRLNSKSGFILLARKLSPEVAEKIESRKWNLVRQTETRRIYPCGKLAGQLVGFTDIDNRGIAGLELAFDTLLAGEPGWRTYQLDVQGRHHYDSNLPSKLPVNGNDLITTIDLRVQSIVEEELAPALSKFKAQSASAIVMNPRNGEILAITTLPGFDPNIPDKQVQENQKIRPITDLYEPGSTFKIVAAALLLERGLATESTLVDCSDGYVRVFNKTIRDAKRHEVLTLEEVIAYSSNVGTIKLSEVLSPELLYDEVKRFGFLSKTGIELSGEANGLLPPPKKWSGLTKPNLVIGHGIAVTMIQMAAAYASIANGGELVRPTLISSTPPVRSVMSPETASKVNKFLIEVVEKGTGKRARIDGLQIAGKTGTAQKINPEGGYSKDRFMASFIGYFPANDPQFLINIAIDEPQGEAGEHQGGDVAAPIFKNIAGRIAGLNPHMRNSSRSTEKKTKQEQFVTVPDFKSISFARVEDFITKSNLRLKTSGKGNKVLDQFPPAGVKIRQGETVEVTLGSKPNNRNVVIVPLFVGLSIRDAVKKASSVGLTVQVDGSGKVISQNPPSGAEVGWGDICQLQAEG